MHFSPAMHVEISNAPYRAGGAYRPCPAKCATKPTGYCNRTAPHTVKSADTDEPAATTTTTARVPGRIASATHAAVRFDGAVVDKARRADDHDPSATTPATA
jgi:hypothetical protein